MVKSGNQQKQQIPMNDKINDNDEIDELPAATKKRKGEALTKESSKKNLGPGRPRLPRTITKKKVVASPAINITTLNVLQFQIRELTSKVANLERLLIETKDKVTKEESIPSTLFSGLFKPNETTPTMAEAKLVCGLTAHNSDRERREKNIIIMGAKVATNTQSPDVEAFTYTSKLFSHLKLDVSSIKNCKRLRAVGNHPGIIKVSLKSKEVRLSALKLSKTLQRSEIYNDVYINADLTREERMVQKMNRADVKELNKKLSASDKKLFSYGINKTNGKIVKFHEKQQTVTHENQSIHPTQAICPPSLMSLSTNPPTTTGQHKDLTPQTNKNDQVRPNANISVSQASQSTTDNSSQQAIPQQISSTSLHSDEAITDNQVDMETEHSDEHNTQ